MKKKRLSDQCYDWSDIRYPESDNKRPSAETKAACSATSTLGVRVAWFVDRAVQTLREIGVQVRTGSGPWAEVLPLCQSIGVHPAYGLCSHQVSATGAGVCGQPSTGSGYPQANLRDQPRTVATAGATIEWDCECDSYHPTLRVYPKRYGRCSGRQYAPRLLSSSTTARGAMP